LDNRNKINEHNAKYAAGFVTYKQKLNFLHDLDQDELKKLTGLKINAKNSARPAAVETATTKRLTTTSRRVTTTSKPITTTSRRVTTTSKPITTTPKGTSTTTLITLVKQNTSTAFGTLVSNLVDWRNVSGYVQPVKGQQACG